jgi:lysyl-tRNA synthetase class I
VLAVKPRTEFTPRWIERMKERQRKIWFIEADERIRKMEQDHRKKMQEFQERTQKQMTLIRKDADAAFAYAQSSAIIRTVM